jgi:hypothetical protein
MYLTVLLMVVSSKKFSNLPSEAANNFLPHVVESPGGSFKAEGLGL